ncbi:MAG: hypothetical protein O3A46_03905 [Candidatus Poribacteria bacterium]|nr:hypothetical protein [Candidatus Poribacteria bacterium]
MHAKLLDIVEIRRHLVEYPHVKIGEQAVVLLVHGDHEGYTLELMGSDPEDPEMITVDAETVHVIWKYEDHKTAMRGAV